MGFLSERDTHGWPALGPSALHWFDGLLSRSMPIKKRRDLFTPGERCSTLYAIEGGAFKTRLVNREGLEQVMGFYLVGDVIGVDGIANDCHVLQATALEDSEVSTVRWQHLDALEPNSSALQRDLMCCMAWEAARVQEMMLVLGRMNSHARLATFLLDLSRRLHFRGYSTSTLRLPMSRSDIGSYLGMTIETISRAFSEFQRLGWLQREGRVVKLLDFPALRKAASYHGRTLQAPSGEPVRRANVVTQSTLFGEIILNLT